MINRGTACKNSIIVNEYKDDQHKISNPLFILPHCRCSLSLRCYVHDTCSIFPRNVVPQEMMKSMRSSLPTDNYLTGNTKIHVSPIWRWHIVSTSELLLVMMGWWANSFVGQHFNCRISWWNSEPWLHTIINCKSNGHRWDNLNHTKQAIINHQVP